MKCCTRSLRNAIILLLVFCLMWSFSFESKAAEPPDAYADSFDASTSAVILAPNEAIGAPDGTFATVVTAVGVVNLTLDMGASEEGTGDLTVYYGALALAVAPTVIFLDVDSQPVYTTTALLALHLTPGVYEVTVDYPEASGAYRFVRFFNVLAAYTIDAVESATFRPDSDNDSLPDIWEITYGLDPLDAVEANGAGGDSDADGLTNAQEYASGSDPTLSDTDSDTLPDGWEVSHGLDTTDATGDNGQDGDPDGDGLTNADEYAGNTDPSNADSDSDGLPDGWEVSHGLGPTDATGDNGSDGDPDGDGLSNGDEYADNTDPDDADSDGDGLSDGDEHTGGTSPTSNDTDGDGLPDAWEVQNGLNPIVGTGADGAGGDPDADALTNAQELAYNTDPTDADSDDDQLPDGWEIQNGLNPLNAVGIYGTDGDSDEDALTNAQELAHHTDPTIPDTDGDSLPDGWEVQHGLAPLDATGLHGSDGDFDSDGLTNSQEWGYQTDPSNSDTDGDTLPDAWEIEYSLDPRNATGCNCATGDPDGDGLDNAQERTNHTNPTRADTDGDTLPDGWEVTYGLSPVSADGDNGAGGDPDRDGRTNAEEYADRTNPTAFEVFSLLPLIVRG